MKRAKKSSTAQAVGRSGRTDCWHGTPEQQQKDAESADWCFIGQGSRLHAFRPEGKYLIARCGRGPAGSSAYVWVDAEPCKECLAMIRSANRGR